MNDNKASNFETADSDQITAAAKRLAALAMSYGGMWHSADGDGSKTGSKVVMALGTALAFAIHEIARPGKTEALADDMRGMIGDVLRTLGEREAEKIEEAGAGLDVVA